MSPPTATGTTTAVSVVAGAVTTLASPQAIQTASASVQLTNSTTVTPPPSPPSLAAIVAVAVTVLSIIGTLAGILSYTTSVRAITCALCRLRHHDALEAAKQRWPLAAALYGAFLLPEPGFRGESTPEGCALIAVERVILGQLGVTSSLEGRGDDETVARVAKRARGLFVSAGGQYRFPRRRCCWLLGAHDDEVLAAIGEYSCQG